MYLCIRGCYTHVKLKQPECSENTHAREYPRRPMIIHTVDSYQIHFIQSQNLPKPRTYAKAYTNKHICVVFKKL